MKKIIALLVISAAFAGPASANWGCKGESNTGYRAGNWNVPTERAVRENTAGYCVARQQCTIVCSDGVDTQAQNHERWPLSADQKIFSCRNDPKCKTE